MNLKLAETPFISIQGEGLTVNNSSYFIRFSGCPVKCSWCDTAYSYTEKGMDYDTKDIYKELKSLSSFYSDKKVNSIVFTGGEPLLWQDELALMVRELKENPSINMSIEIETTGMLDFKKPLLYELSTYGFSNININVSPKMFYIKEHPESKEILINNLKILESLGIDFILKFVDEDREDMLKLINQIRVSIKDFNHRVYVMPQCVTREEHLAKFESTLDFVMRNGYIFSPRLQILLWDSKKGV